MDITKPYLHTETVGGAKMTSHHRGCVGIQVQSDHVQQSTLRQSSPKSSLIDRLWSQSLMHLSKLLVLLKTLVMGRPIVLHTMCPFYVQVQYSTLCAHSMYRFSVTEVDTQTPLQGASSKFLFAAHIALSDSICIHSFCFQKHMAVAVNCSPVHSDGLTWTKRGGSI